MAIAMAIAQTSISSPDSASAIVSHDSVRVPNWILSDTTLDVMFNERATSQIDEFQMNRVNYTTSFILFGHSDI